jgi:hypothetical protein
MGLNDLDALIERGCLEELGVSADNITSAVPLTMQHAASWTIVFSVQLDLDGAEIIRCANNATDRWEAGRFRLIEPNLTAFADLTAGDDFLTIPGVAVAWERIVTRTR